MNLVVLKGNLTSDPELRYIESMGKQVAVASFSLAINRRYTKTDGTKQEETTFVRCEAWASGAELITKYVHKGDPLLISGSLKEDRWETPEGVKRSQMKVRVDTFEFLTRKGDATQAEPAEATPVAVSSDGAEQF